MKTKPRRFTPPKGGPRCARRAEVARLGTGRVMGGYVARGCCSREAALDSLRSYALPFKSTP
jgi:hypothetical protein